MYFRLFAILSIVVALPCLAQTSKKPAPVTFENLIKQSGINFTLKNSVSPKRFSIETMTGGVAAFDYDNDGFLDLFFTNGAAIPSLEKSDASYSNRLFHNNHDGTFTDVTTKSGLAGIGYSMGVAAGDYDNDGFVDLYVTGYNRNQLYHNNHDGTFTDVTDKAHVPGNLPGTATKAWSVTAGWFDYNNDGKLDLLVINYLDYDIKSVPGCTTANLPSYCSPSTFHPVPEHPLSQQRRRNLHRRLHPLAHRAIPQQGHGRSLRRLR